MSQPDRLPGTPELRLTLPKDGGEARGHLLIEFGGNGTHKFLLRKGSLVVAEARPGLGDPAGSARTCVPTADSPTPPGSHRARRAG